MVSQVREHQPHLMIEIISDPEQGGFTAHLPDIPAYGEGSTEQEAIDDLQQALRGYIQTFGLDDAMRRLVPPRLRSVQWNLKDLARA